MRRELVRVAEVEAVGVAPVGTKVGAVVEAEADVEGTEAAFLLLFLFFEQSARFALRLTRAPVGERLNKYGRNDVVANSNGGS